MIVVAESVFCCFVISPGRCGTQWLANFLQSSLPQAKVEHEPLPLAYQPLYNCAEQPLLRNKQEIERHLSQVIECLNNGTSYIETGFPCWRHIRWMYREIEKNTSAKVKVIHLVREPLSNAASLLKLNAFVPPILPTVPIKEFIRPDSPGVAIAELVPDWQTLSAFNKCIYYWIEVQKEALKLKVELAQDNCLAICFESMFSLQTATDVLRFLQAKCSEEMILPEKIDQYGTPWLPVESMVVDDTILQAANTIYHELL